MKMFKYSIMKIVRISLLQSLALYTFTNGLPGPAVTPVMVAENVAEKIYANKDNFFKWDYTGAVIFDGLFQSDEIFHMNYSTIINSYLDQWMTDKYSYGYKLLHDEAIEKGRAVGDTISLFPINYLNRILTAPSTTKPSFNKTLYEQLVMKDVMEYIIKWPYRLSDGTFSRHSGWPGQTDKNASFVWADDQYMGLTLLARLSAYNNGGESMEIAKKVGEMALNFAKYLRDPQDGLFYHGYNHATMEHSCCKWGRGNGWGLMSHIEVLNALANHPELVQTKMFQELKMILEEHVKAMIRHQPLDGRWHQVVNDPETYLETSVTAMTLYTLTRACLQNWLPASNEVHGAIMKAWEGLLKTIDMKDGTVSGICSGAGIFTSPSEYDKVPTSYMTSYPGIGSVLYAVNYMELYMRKREANVRMEQPALL